MTAAEIGAAIVGALTSGLSMVGTVAESILEGFNALFITTNGLSVFATAMLVFGGIALAVGIGRLVLKLIRSKVG